MHSYFDNMSVLLVLSGKGVWSEQKLTRWFSGCRIGLFLIMDTVHSMFTVLPFLVQLSVFGWPHFPQTHCHNSSQEQFLSESLALVLSVLKYGAKKDLLSTDNTASRSLQSLCSVLLNFVISSSYKCIFQCFYLSANIFSLFFILSRSLFLSSAFFWTKIRQHSSKTIHVKCCV